MILGGGISGLYAAYTLLQNNPILHITIVEKGSRWGGRIFTDTRLEVETGGARFNRDHIHVLQLIDELQLTSKIEPIDNKVKIAEEPNQSIATILLKLGTYNTLDFGHDLTKYTLEEYMHMVLSDHEVEFLKDSIGYYAEIVVMNAKDAIHLLQHLAQPFFSLKDGLSQLIHEMVRRLKMYPYCTMKLNEEVISVRATKHGYYKKEGYTVKTSQQVYSVPWCICTLEKNVVQKLGLGIKGLNYLTNGPLCRIFCTFEKPWYKSMPKFTSKTPLRIIIPHNKCIQLSYSDHKFAIFWQQVYAKYGVAGVNRSLVYFVKDALGIDIPMPLTTHVHFWSYGVAYWCKNANSEKLSPYFQEPLPNFYLCSDAYSSTFQQWMEGGLGMSAEACRRIISKEVEPVVTV